MTTPNRKDSNVIPFDRILAINPSMQISRDASPPLPAYAKFSLRADPDESKGAVEDDAPKQKGIVNESNSSLAGQMGHRNKPDEIGDSDTDYPEPDASGEHSGEKK